MMNGFGGMLGGLGTLLVLSWISLLAVAIWAVARIIPPRTDAEHRSEAGEDPAVEALRLRFGRGEIGTEEYLRALEILEPGSSTPKKELPLR